MGIVSGIINQKMLDVVLVECACSVSSLKILAQKGTVRLCIRVVFWISDELGVKCDWGILAYGCCLELYPTSQDAYCRR